MKVTRSFWLGLGSGLILSAMIAVFFSPQLRLIDEQPNNQISTLSDLPAEDQMPIQPDSNSQTLPPHTEEEKKEPSPTVESSDSTLKESLTEPLDTAQTERDFVIPKGATAERISELLLNEGFIADKNAFLEQALQMRVERKFRVGTFKLAAGLTVEEIINRLLK